VDGWNISTLGDADSNPLDRERNIRKEVEEGLGFSHGQDVKMADFKLEFLMILEIENEGPYLALLNSRGWKILEM